jgi:phage baseplate assembly protein W
MRRDYGSKLPDLVDAPMNAETIVDIYAATAGALQSWEPRFKLTQVTLTNAAPGEVTLDVTGIYVPTGQAVALDGIKVS